ncbi:MAG: hypothetical protein FJX77_15355, partial [Armatimonadetes bacterium]|nr:hypothetical protein [Armatimonadota bacterium]
MRSSFTRRQALKAGIFSLAGTAMGWQAAEAQVSGLPRFFYGDAAVQDGDGIASLALDGRTIYPAFSLGNGRGFVLMKGRASLRRGGFSTRLSRVIGSDRGASAGLVDGGQVEGDLFSNALGEGGFSAAEFPVDLDLGPKMVGFWVTPEGYKDFAQLELNRRGNLRAAGTLTGIGRFNF